MSKSILTHDLYNKLDGGICPICSGYFKPNGTGNEGAKFTHWILSKMPWDDILQEEAVPIHDWRCHIGEYHTNISFKETTKEFKDNIERAIKRWMKRRWYRKFVFRPALNYIDDIYAWAVSSTKTGKEAYDRNSCVLPD